MKTGGNNAIVSQIFLIYWIIRYERNDFL